MPSRKPQKLKSNNNSNARRRPKDPGIRQPSVHQCNSRSEKVPIELLQLLLNVYNDTLTSHSHSSLSDLIQQVKHYLFNREFSKAFEREDFREAYAVRWSPSRALAYISILYSLPIITTCLRSESLDDTDLFSALDDSSEAFHLAKGRREKVSRVVCIGAGGGAEIIALGGFLKHLEGTSTSEQAVSEIVSSAGDRSPPICLEVTAIDVAEWSSIVSRLHSGIISAPPLSQYASAGAKAANGPLVDSSMYTVRFVQQDVLDMEIAGLAAIFADVPLVTLLFTLNELYSTSISATTNLLLSLTTLLSPGALLLVVDSPGSYSTVKFGSSSDSHDNGSSKKYPVQWLLDHTLLELAGVGSSKNASAGDRQWEKLESRESEWFRLPEGLVYPIDLEDMRYQLHLYRRR